MNEYRCLHDGAWIIASDMGFWHYENLVLGGPSFTELLNEPGYAATTQQLLAGAIVAALKNVRTIHPAEASAPAPTEITLQQHIHSLVASYQTTHVTPPTMRRVAQRFRDLDHEELAAYCEQVAASKSGHDDLALKDLSALGLDAQALVEHVCPPRSIALAQWFEQLAESDDPAAVLGYAYALKRMALFNNRERVEAVKTIIPRGTMAPRCLRVRNAVGSDENHVAESLQLMANLPAKDKRAIAMALYETIILMMSSPDMPPHGLDETIKLFGMK